MEFSEEKMKQKQLFIAFLRSSLFSFGGGPVAIPLIKKEVVENYNLMSEEEFIETMAIGNTLPGPIITKLAGYIGYKVGGIWGLLNATIASVMPSVLMMALLFQLLYNYRDVDFIQGMTYGVIPIVAVMMLGVFIDLMKNTRKTLGWIKGGGILLVAIISLIVFEIHPGIVVAVTLLLALFLPVKKEGKR